MSLSMIQGASIHRNYSVPVLVVPIGDIHPAVLREYLSALDKFTILPLESLTPPGDYSREKSAFQHMSWKECRLYLRYHLGQGSANGVKVVAWPGDDDVPSTIPDLSPDVKREAVWGSFQNHLNIQVVIGVWHCPSFPNLAEASARFRDLAASVPSSCVVRCFGFDASAEALADPDLVALSHMRLIVADNRGHLGVPPLTFEPQSPTLDPLVHVHIQPNLPSKVTVTPRVSMQLELQLSDAMSEFIAHMDTEVLRIMKHVESSSLMLGVPLLTPIDVVHLTPTQLQKLKSNKRLQSARLRKVAGDACLLAASPEDAYAHYSEALSLCKSQNDGVWAGGAVEGMAAAVLAHTASKLQTHPAHLHVLTEVVMRLEEAIEQYESCGITELAVQARLKLGQYLLTSPVAGVTSATDDSGKPGGYLEIRKGDAIIRGCGYLTNAANSLFLEPQFKLAVLMEASQLFLRVHCKRKALFYLTQACEMLSSMACPVSARVILGWLAAQCGLQPSVAEALRGVTPGMPSVKGTLRLQAVLEQQRRECIEKQMDEPLYDGMVPPTPNLRIKPQTDSSPPPHPHPNKIWTPHKIGLLALLADVSFAVGDDVMTSQCMLALIKDVSSIVKAVGAPLAPSLSVKTSYGGNFTPFTSGIGSPDDSEVVSPITIVSSDGQRPGSVAARKALIRSISAHAVAGSSPAPPRTPGDLDVSITSSLPDVANESFTTDVDVSVATASAANQYAHTSLTERLGFPSHIAHSASAVSIATLFHHQHHAQSRGAALLNAVGAGVVHMFASAEENITALRKGTPTPIFAAHMPPSVSDGSTGSSSRFLSGGKLGPLSRMQSTSDTFGAVLSSPPTPAPSSEHPSPIVFTSAQGTAVAKLPSLSFVAFRSISMRAHRPHGIMSAFATAFSSHKADSPIPGVSYRPYTEECDDLHFISDEYLCEVSDVVQSLPLVLQRCSKRQLAVGVDTFGAPVATSDVQWWLLLHQMNAVFTTFLPSTISMRGHLRRTSSQTHFPVLHEASLGASVHEYLEAKSPKAFDTLDVVTARLPIHRRARDEAWRVNKLRRCASAIIPHSPRLDLLDSHGKSQQRLLNPAEVVPSRQLDVPTALSLNAYPIAKALWHVLKKLPASMTESQRCSLNFSGIPLVKRVVPLPLPASEVPSVRRVRLRVKSAGTAASAFIFNPFEKKKGKKAASLGASSSSHHQNQTAPPVWVAGARTAVRCVVVNPLPIPLRATLTVIARFVRVSGDANDVSPEAVAVSSGVLPDNVLIGTETIVRLPHDPPTSTVDLEFLVPSLPQPLGDSDVSTYYLHILGLHYNCAGFRWFHAFQGALKPPPIPVHPPMPLLKVCKETPTVIPACVHGVGFLPAKHASWVGTRPPTPGSITSPGSEAHLGVTLYTGQATNLVVWLLNGSRDLSADWCGLTVEASGVGDDPHPSSDLITSGAFRPRAKLFDSDPVPLGEETNAPPPITVPFRSTTAMLPESCVDEVRHVSLSASQVVSVGKPNHVVSSDGMLCSVLRLDSAPVAMADVALGRVVDTRFELEWSYSPDVYSPYLMKLHACLNVAVIPGPFIAYMEPVPMAALVSVDGSNPLFAVFKFTLRNPTDELMVISNQPFSTKFGVVVAPGLSSDNASATSPHTQPPFLHVVGCLCNPSVPGAVPPSDTGAGSKSTPVKAPVVQPRFGSPLTGTRSGNGGSGGSGVSQPHALKTGCAACRIGPGSVMDVSVVVRRVDLAAPSLSSASKGVGKGLSAQKQQELIRRQVTMLKGGPGHQQAAVIAPEVEAAQQVLMLTYNTLTGGIGRMVPAPQHVTPAVLSALQTPSVSVALSATADHPLPIDESVSSSVLAAAGTNAVLVRTLLDHWVTLKMTFSCDTGGATATDMVLRAVSTRDLKRVWSSLSRVELGDAPYSELDDFIVDNWTQGDVVTIGNNGGVVVYESSVCPLGTGEFAVFVEYSSPRLQRSNVVLLHVVEDTA